MKINTDMKKPINITVSELILSAVYFLQKKNGVSLKDINKYICNKRGLKQSQMKSKVKEALNRGTNNGIFNVKRGLYRVEPDFKRKLPKLSNKNKKNKSSLKSVKNAEVAPELKLPAIRRKLAVLEDKQMKFSVSKTVFQNDEREQSFALAKARDEDNFFDDDDEEEDDYDDYSESNLSEKMDIYTMPVLSDISVQFSEFGIYNAAKRGERKRASIKKREPKNKSGKMKKRQTPKPSRKTQVKTQVKTQEKTQVSKKKPTSTTIESDDDDFFDDYESDFEDSDFEIPLKKTKILAPHSFEAFPNEQNNKTVLEQLKKKTEKNEVQKLDGKRKEEAKETKVTGETAKTKNMRKQRRAKQVRKCKKKKYPTSGTRQQRKPRTVRKEHDNALRKNELSSVESKRNVASSTKLLPRNLNISLSSNLTVSDFKISPSNIKSETQDSTMLLFSGVTFSRAAAV